MLILGLSAFYHDSAAAIIHDGEIIAAVQEERFTRIKHDSAFPFKAVEFCLSKAGARIEDLHSIAFFEKPLVKFERLLETYLATAPRSFSSFHQAMPIWLHEKLFQKSILEKCLSLNARKHTENGIRSRLLFCDHHMSHAASAFYPSPYEEAVILTLDGVGEWACASAGYGRGNMINLEREIRFPHSLGLLYSAFTAYLGFKVNSGEYKMMGLAPYGEPRFRQKILDHIVDVKEDGSFRLDMRYFNYLGGLTMTSPAFHTLFGRPPRQADENLDEFHHDIAASIQAVTEEIVCRMGQSLSRQYRGIRYLCMAGGVALNCVANGRLRREGYFEDIWVQPAAGDSGGALGAALAALYQHHGLPRTAFFGQDSMKGGLLGPSFTNEEIETSLKRCGAVYEKISQNQMIDITAHAIVEQKAVGWVQGPMEYGPRALGGRSILADARSPHMQKDLNLKTKFRESFRPFAPAVLSEAADAWFDLQGKTSPYMLFTAPIQKKRRTSSTSEQKNIHAVRSEIPAVTHLDYSARVQTVSEKDNPLFHALISRFASMTGVPVLLNTSFNVRGEPIVCTPEDAFRCFMGCGIDVLAIGNFIIRKEHQTVPENKSHSTSFAPD